MASGFPLAPCRSDRTWRTSVKKNSNTLPGGTLLCTSPSYPSEGRQALTALARLLGRVAARELIRASETRRQPAAPEQLYDLARLTLAYQGTGTDG